MRNAAEHKRFESVRAKWIKASAARDAARSKYTAKYGPDWDPTWLTESEQKRYRALRDRQESQCEAFYCLLDDLGTPRNWRRGVPVWWVVGSLPFEDAVRPVNQRLSVTPPIANGYSRPKS